MYKQSISNIFAGAFAAAAISFPGLASAGLQPDASFGSDGSTRLAPFSGYESVTGLAMAADGGILAVGGAEVDGQSGGMDLVLMRLDGTGRLDVGFADAGIAVLDVDGAYDTATSVALAPDGGILVAGYTGLEGLVVRYDAQGHLDTDFGSGGMVAISGPGIDALEFDDIAVDGAGRIYLTGRYTVAEGGEYPDQDFLAVRLLADGQLDPGFGDGGFARVTGTAAESTALVLDDAGRLLLAGDTGSGYLFARLDTDGQRDPSFGFDGVSEVSISGNPRLSTVIQSEDGRYFAAGLGGKGVLALDDDGGPTATFGAEGIADVAGAADIHSLSLDDQGRLLAAGGLAPKSGSPDQDFFIVRLDTGDGSELARDTLDIGVYRPDAAIDLAVDGAGRTVLGGFADNGADHDFAFARITESVETSSDTTQENSQENTQATSDDDQGSDDDGSSSSSGSGSSSGGTTRQASSDTGGGGGGSAGLALLGLMLAAALRRRDYQNERA